MAAILLPPGTNDAVRHTALRICEGGEMRRRDSSDHQGDVMRLSDPIRQSGLAGLNSSRRGQESSILPSRVDLVGCAAGDVRRLLDAMPALRGVP